MCGISLWLKNLMCFIFFLLSLLWWKNNLRPHVKIIQSDGGGEYVNRCLTNFFLVHCFSCLGTPEQNGLAKRHHCHIVETRHTLLAHSSMPPKFWTATFHTAIYLINRLPTRVLNGKSLFEFVFDSLSKYASLRTFGCTCYPYLDPFGCSKLESKSTH